MTEKEILTQHIADHQKAIDTAREKLATLEVTYSVGDRFVWEWNNKKYLMTSSGSSAGLSALETGNSFRFPIKVACLCKITQKEFNGIIGGETMTRYWDLQRKILTKL